MPLSMPYGRPSPARRRAVATTLSPVVVIAQTEAQEHAEAVLVELFNENNFGHGVLGSGAEAHVFV